MSITLSPMMLQWHKCKKKAKDALLLFRLGDFYEAFEKDAEILSKQLDLVLTKRQDIPMAGIPAHTCEVYIDKLVSKGFRVAIAEQMEDPKQTKGIVKREIVRIITPGTLISSQLLSDKSSNFLASVAQINASFGLAILDLTTADFRLMEFEELQELQSELSRLQPKEMLISEKSRKNFSEHTSIQTREEWFFDHKTAYERLLKHFQVHSLDGFGLKGMAAAINAAGALFAYVKDDLNLSLDHIKTIRLQKYAHYMSIDATTQRHLELFQSLHDKGLTLLDLIDQTVTPMGGRLMKEWLLHPLLSVSDIKMRQDLVEERLFQPQTTLHLKDQLKNVHDLERLIMRIETGYASPRDLVGLRFSLEPVPVIAQLLNKTLPDLSAIVHKIREALIETPPLRLSEGGSFKTGYHSELDELQALKSNSQSWMLSYQTELREKTLIKTLKVGYTQAFGYYIEASRSQSEKMPAYFQRRQTLVNAERFISPELKEYEHKILTAESRIASLENELFTALRKEIALQAAAIRSVAREIAETDCFVSLAQIAKTYCFVRPTVDDSDFFSIEEGRHPVIETALQSETFIPNDVLLDEYKNRLLLITGPNMAGKSTYIRQVALTAILAQMGSFVPAKQAHIGVIDKLFSRIGASDDLSRGQSTFMVEMTETANILHNATSRSLVILDEIGRGTSTYDGISIAWAVAEYLLTAKGKRAKTLFATHYWELTKLEDEIPGAVNFNVAVHESEKGIVFLRKIVRGGTDKSYGIHVAKLAGLPATVIKRAQEMLKSLHANAAEPILKEEKQLELF